MSILRKLNYAIALASLLPFTTIQAAPGVLADEPLITATSVDPNILFLLDSSGSMLHIVIDEPYDPNTTYYNCPGSMTLTPGNTLAARVTWGSGKAYFRYGNYTYDWGTSPGDGYTGRPKRCFDPNLDYSSALYANYNASWAKYASGYGTTLYSGNYLNWYFGSAPNFWGSSARSKPGTERRIEVAQDSAVELVDGLEDVRVGLAKFNGSSGARILVGVDDISSNKTDVINGINAISASGSTPLAESLHEIGRYFVQGSNNTLTLHPDQANETTKSAYTVFNHTPAYSSGVTQSSPIQYFCQKSFVVMLTDGRPTQDRDIDTSTGLTDYDGDCTNVEPACLSYDRKPNYVYESSGSDYLDDVAQALFEIDLRPDLTHIDGSEAKNNIGTYVIGFADKVVQGDQLLKDTASQGGGLFFNAENTSSLSEVFSDISNDIFSKVNTAAGATFNSSTLSNDTSIYQVQYSTQGWTGDLLKYPVDLTGNVGAQEWSARDLLESLPIATRVMMTYNEDTKQGVPFRQLNQLSAAQQNDLNTSPTGVNDSLGQQRIDYLRGDRSLEGTTFRTRNYLLADLVHSAPIFVGKPESGWPDNAPFPTASGSKYSDFVTSKKNRTQAVYVGDNGGMLQAFDANTGANLLSYLPSNLFSADTAKGMHYLTDPAYQHKYYVDLSASVQDAYVKTTPAGSKSWSTILVSGQRGGGRGYVALDVTDPASFTETNANNLLLWEFSSSVDPDLGFTFSEPVIGRMNNGRWAAIVGNGYNSTGTGSAKLFIIYLDGGLDGTWTKGTDYIVIDTKKGTLADLNGLSSPAPVDLDGNRTIDRIYAGDLWGNLWAFDVADGSAGNWKVAYGSVSSPQRLFNAPGKKRSITSRPIAIKHPTIGIVDSNKPNILVLFGTGSYLTSADITTTNQQAFYAVWDAGKSKITDSDLVEQDIIVDTGSKRVMGNAAVPYGETDPNLKKYGWFIKLDSGERVIVSPLVLGPIVFFNTLIPDVSSPCSFGGSGWLMAVNIENGGEPEFVVIDVNNDSQLDDTDKYNNQIVSGVKFGNGIPMQGAIRGEYLFVPGSAGEISTFRIFNNDDLLGRISWEDLARYD